MADIAIPEIECWDDDWKSIPRAYRTENPPLSSGQQRLWFLDQLEPGQAVYNVPMALRLSGDLDILDLEASLSDLWWRHDALRSRVETTAGEPRQETCDAPLIVGRIDFRHEPDPEARVMEWAAAEARRPFDLERGPLMRATLLSQADRNHLLVLVFHHIAIDGWSIGIFCKELGEIYSARQECRPCLLPELPLQYADYAIWQKDWLLGDAPQRQLEYWKKQLTGIERLELASDRPRPAVQTFHGDCEAFVIPVALMAALRKLSRREGATLFMTLLAGLKILMARYTGSYDIAIGSPVANRNRPELEALIGFFVNTLVLRTAVKPSDSARDLLRRVRGVCLDAWAHQELAFDKLVEEIQPERDLSRPPLFQVLFSLQNAPDSGVHLAGLESSLLPLGTGTSKLDLNVTLAEDDDRLVGTLEYNTDLFDRATVQRLIGHYRTVLESIAADPEQRVSQVAVLDSAERAQIAAWSQTAQQVSAHGIVELFEEQALHNPSATAVQFGEVSLGASLNYAELNSRANQLAHYLQELGIGAECRVGICLERSLEMLVALLGTLKAGAAYVPLDPAYPAERLDYMAADAGIEILLTSEKTRIAALARKEICLDADWNQIARQPQDNLGITIYPEQLAYLIYTSGSTGRPKGAMITHGGLSNYLQWAAERYEVSAGSGSAVHSSLSFDLTVTSLYLPLVSGKTVRLLEAGAGIDELAEVLHQSRGLSLLKLTPAHLEVLEQRLGPVDLQGHVRALVIGGEALHESTLQYWRRQAPGTRLINEYGPTETVVGCCVYEAAADGGLGDVLIGRPIGNAQMHVLDGNLEAVPVGVAGEIYIGGAGVGRGYWGRAELTAERFVPDGCGGQAGARLYRTGDRARYRANGEIEYLGRQDDQVKIRGYRVELGEIEATLAQHAAVGQAAVALRNERLIAYVSSAGAEAPTAAELRAYLKERLPEYEVPSVYVVLGQMPLTVNGKVDRKALPEPELPSEEDGRQGPRTAVESLLSEIWAQAEVLGVEQLGIHDNFFDLGGHSLLATRVISRVRQTFDVEMPLRSLFEAPTIAGMAERVETAMSGDAVRPAQPIVRVGRGSPLPVSYAQQRLWFLDQLEPGSASYNVPLVVSLSGALKREAVAASLAELVRRHEVLRTRFVAVDGEPRQQIDEDVNFKLLTIDCTGREEAARQWAQQEACRPFDLAAGPLMRATLLQLSPSEHWLVLVLHHIVVDGWAVGILLHELAALYQARVVAGESSPLPELPLQYADYSVWQRRWMEGEIHGRQLDYWRQQLAGLEPLELPTDRPRPSVQTLRGATESFELPPRLAVALQQLCRREGATLFMTLLAGFDIVLARHSGSKEVAVGSPVANRNRAEIEGLIGFFVNTLVLRADLSDHPSFRQLLARVRKTCLDAYAHQDLPFEKLVEELQPVRDLSRTPLFQVLFALQNAPYGAVAWHGCESRFIPISTDTAKFDLNVSLHESEGGLIGTLEYNIDLFDRATVRRLIGHYRNVLESIAADPEQRVSQVALLDSVERAQIAAWNRTSLAVSAHGIVELFEEQALHNAAATAVQFGDVSLNYAELNSRANQLAHYLQALGIGAECRVGICLERSLEMLVALLGTLKAGAAYVPLDPAYPTERLDFMAADAGIEILLTQWETRQRIAALIDKEICLDVDWDQIARQPQDNLGITIDPEQLAYLIYTSGSTGKPKGAMITHGGLSNYLQWAAERYEVSAGSGSAVHSSLSFDLTVTSLYLPLISGKTVRLLEAGAGIDELADVLRQSRGLSLLKLTPAHLEVLEQRLELVDLQGHVRALVIGGEALHESTLRYWRRQAPGTRLFNEYGPTETVVGCCVYEAAEDGGLGDVLIGRPIGNAQMHVLDGNLEAVPVGVAGEIYIGGAGVGRGYWGRAELTAERFVPDGSGGQAGARLYRTGDRARYRANGEIEYLGRQDDQVKIRGYRVELGEIEATLAQHAAVGQAAVALRNERLIAYVSGAGAEPPTAAELRAYLKERLPEYEVPSIYVVLEQMPLTANGKVDRKALPAPEAQDDETAASLATFTPVESLLRSIWEEVLGTAELGLHDSFFELGGHSLLATRVTSRIRQTFGIEISLRSLFEAPTIAELAARVEAAMRGDVVISAPVSRVPRGGLLPVSFAQQRLWFLDQLSPGGATYNVPLALRLTGDLDVAALKAALTGLAQRHEVLRTSFVTADGGSALQRIDDVAEIPLTQVDFTGESDASAQAQLWAEHEARRPFQLSAAPLFRAALARFGEREHWLVLVLHHIVIDGWSLEIVVKDIHALYLAHHLEKACPLAELPVQYADYAAWQRLWLEGAVRQRQLDYWKRQLDGLEPLGLPTDRPLPPVQTFDGAVEPFELPETLADPLQKLCRREGVTLFMTLLGAWQVLLMRYTGREDIAVGAPVANRGRAEIERLIGFFVNTLVLRTNLSGNPRFREVLGRVRKTCLDAYANQDLPFEELVEELHPERDLSRPPLFQVMLALQDASQSSLHLPGLETSYLPLHTGTSKFQLNLNLVETNGKVSGVVEYNTGLFDSATIRRMGAHFIEVLNAIVADPERRIAELPVLTDSERLQIAGWNETTHAYPVQSVADLFEAQVERTPAALAVVSAAGSIDYATLNQRANQLGYYLLELGVGPETRVGICVERSIDMVVALLGVLKAGGAYVPLDPAYPSERLQYMAADSHVQILLTHWSSRQDFGQSAMREVFLDLDWAEIATRPAANPRRQILPDQLAYLIYTSGSTGWPKGAMITHRGLSNYLQWASQAYECGRGTGSAVHSSLSFDLTVTSLYLPLIAGSTVRLLNPNADLDDLAQLIREADGLNLLKLTPAHLEALEQRLAHSQLAGRVHRLVIGGEALHGAALSFWKERAAGTRLINEYGPTETVVGCCVYDAADDIGIGPVPIGRPIANLQIRILDANLEALPVGVPGEIYIGGDGVGRGYQGLPCLTAERFVPDPFGAVHGGRMYKTGDLARYRADGNIEYLGRLDHQVKVRGYRVELGGIEAAIAAHPDVTQAAVSLRRRPDGSEALVAHVAAAESANLTAADLRRFLKLRLPEYEIPAAFVVLESLPLTVNGKVDRNALPEPDAARGDADIHEAPRTAVEGLLSEIWAQAEVLGVENLGIHDNFFELGGHSLLATRVMSRVRETFDVEMPLRSLFEAPTIASMAERVETALHGDLRATGAVQRIGRTGMLAASYAQRRLWFLDQLEPLSSSYNVPFVLGLSGELNAAALEQALTHLVQRHEVLRTRLVTHGDEPVQQIDDGADFALRLVDCGGSEQQARDWAQREALRPFNLAADLLFRAALLKIAPDEHWLVLVMHHIVIDGWSVGILLRELKALYEGFQANEPCRLPALPVQYADYAAWQHQWMTGDACQRQLAYWTDQLSGLEPLEVPPDRPRPAVQSFRGATESFTLPQPLTDALQKLSRRESVTLFMTLLGAWQTLLARYCGRKDIAVGSPVANRNRAEIEGLIGFFVNTLVLRADLSDDPSFRQLLGRVRKTCLDAYAHQDLPFEKLVEELQPERDLSRPPLFQILFALQNAHDAGLELAGLQGRFVSISTDTAKFDLNVSLHESERGLLGTLEYNTDLFDRATAQRLIGHYRTVLESIAADPEQRVSQVALLDSVERAQIAAWNQTSQRVSACGIVELFEEQALRNPAATAVQFGDLSLSYAELNRRANQLAHYLREFGIGAECRVGICLERSLEMLVALLGTLKASTAYVPLDPAYPAERLEYMSADAGIEILLTSQKTRIPALAGKEICLDADWNQIARQPEDNLGITIDPEQLAYLIYTSGSTGKPKGAMITHGGLSNYLQWAAERYEVSAGSGSAVHSSLSFDLTVTSLYLPLVSGKTVRLLEADAGIDELAEVLRQARGLSLLKLTPAHLEVLEQRLGAVDLQGHVRALVIGGEALHESTLQYWRRQAPGTRLINEYGPTETVVGCCVYEAAADGGLGDVLIGRPIGNAQMHVLDGNLEPVPVGVAGEIYIGGAGVGRGYWGRAELTAERFVPDGCGGQAGARLYRTGDRARYRANGEIEYLGRQDDQVKIRGYRVELGEIEATLAQHAAVGQAAVALRDQRLIAYVSGAGAEAPTAAELRAYLKERLPEYEVPSVYVVLEQMPLTVNGKVDRKALPEPELPSEEDNRQGPRTAVESLLSEIWAQAEVLGVEQLGIHDNFFDLGGHSLLATRVISRVRQTFDVEMPLRSLFEAPTIAGMAERVETAMSGEAVRPAERIVRVGRGSPLPVSYAQQRLWFLDQLEPGSASYNVPLVVSLSGELKREAVEASLAELVRRHEVLRTRFVAVDGEPRQQIEEDSPVHLAYVDLRSTGNPSEAALQWAQAEVRHPFNLATGPLLRLTVVCAGDQEHLLVFAMHHIVLDGWSVGILLHEFAALYQSHCAHMPSSLPELPVQYADYSVWQRKWLASGIHDSQLEYWKQQLAGLEILELPADRPRPAVPSGRGATVPVELSEALTDALRRLSRREGATLFMTLLAGFDVLLARYSGRNDIAVGSPVANRHRAEIEGLIGFFVNTIVLRADLQGDPSFRQLLERVRKTCLDAYAHQDLPFEKLVEEIQPERDLSRTPLFQVMFSLNDSPETETRIAGLRASFLPAHTGTSKFDLNLHLCDRGARIAGLLEYNTDLFEPATIERILTHYLTVLEAVANNSQQPVSAIPLLSVAERAQQALWNQTERAYSPASMMELFERQAETTPHAIAMECAGERRTYAELNSRANQLAHYLQTLGIGAECRVGICLERSLEMLVALLGTLKAGTAYVPLDPAYPADRLDYMAADAGIEILLTQWETRQRIAALSGKEICLDADWNQIARQPENNPGVAIDPEQLAYLIYTSGSTGRPKGAMITHGGLSNYLQWAVENCSALEGSGSAVHSSLSFDLTVTSLWVPLLAGKTVHLLEPGAGIDELAEVLRHARGLSLLKLTPAHLEVLEQRLGPVDLQGHVRALVIGGETLHEAALTYWRKHAPGTRLINEYGPTETVVGTTVCEAPEDRGLGSVPIGRPIANVRMHLLDGNLEPAPVGVAGEIYIGGAGVGRGYWGRTELTAERFVPDGSSGQAGARLYRTGDRARCLPSGEIEYLGRLDDQVKIRGYRVELGEIETTLAQHPAVAHCAVVMRRQPDRLVAYVVSEPGVAFDRLQLRAYLKEHLPEYEIPTAWTELSELPLTPNGKVDRRALPQPDALATVTAAFYGPRTAVEGLVSEIWLDVLGAKQIGIHDNFFELGGHSLIATQVISRIRQVFSIELPLRALFEASTIAGLAARVESALQGGAPTVTLPLAPADRAGRVPLSYAQQRLWFLHLLDPGSAAYNIPFALRLRGQLDVTALGDSLSALVKRHEALRTRFVAEDDEPLQVVDAASAVNLRIVDFSGASDSEQEANLWAHQEAQAAFDLSRGPLLRASLMRLAEDHHVLLLVMHHVVVDGWSFGVLLRELSALYDACRQGRAGFLPELKIQYADYAIWQRQWLRGEVQDRQLSYWKQQLAGLEVLEVNPDRPRPAVQTFTGSCERLDLSAPLGEALRRLCRREGATMFMTLLGSFQVLLARYTGRTDVAVGTPVANRTRMETEDLIGFFVNTMVLRTNLDGDPNFREVIRRVRKVCLDGYANQDLPFETLVEELHPHRDLSRPPLFTILFQVQNSPESALAMPGLETQPYPLGTGTAKFDLHLAFSESEGRLAGALEYNTDLFDASTVQRLLQHFVTLLEGIAADSEQSIAQLPLLSAPELRQQADWNQTARPYSRQASLAGLFEERATESRDSVALLSGDRSMNYGQLNAQANQLAHYLLELGAGRESRIGVCLERSTDLTVALLAVLKAGCAYVPLDPDFPPARIEHMIADSEIEILLTRTEFRRATCVRVRHEVRLDAAWETIATRDSANPGIDISPDQVAYVIYTSGSTGVPKGVLGLHGATINRLEWMYAEYPWEPGEVCCAKASLNFVDSIGELLGGLLAGIPTVLLPSSLNYDLVEFARTLVRHRVTRLVMVPSLLRAILEAHAAGQIPMPELKLWVTSGEPLPAALAAEFHKRVRKGRLLNLYGSSEDAGDVTYCEVESHASAAPAPIGRPIANTQVYILDRDLNRVPVGIPGEICIAGECLARGYQNLPDLTARQFVPDPFSAQPGSRMYRTGDIGRFLPDGNVAFLGRWDNQVKVRGHRIETGEVEAALESHPSIRQAVVTAVQDPVSGNSLAAYFVADGETPSPAALREFLQQTLPAYMTPSLFIEMAQMPLLPNAKVDRRALPAPVRTAPASIVAAPRTELEEVITGIWKALLEIETLSVDDNFFDAGGHSLQIVRLRSELRKTFGRDLAVLDLFMHPTVRSLASFLSNGHRDVFSIADINHRARMRREYFTRIQREVKRRVEL